MCGILGYKCFGDKRPKVVDLEIMFSLSGQRGKEASGTAFIHEDKMLFFKEPKSSDELMKTEIWENFTKNLPSVAILHTRNPSTGAKAENNDNNHPMIFNNWAVVHNGKINNVKELEKQYNVKVPNNIQSDTIILPMLLDKLGFDKFIDNASSMKGDATFAALNVKEPDKLYLFRRNKTLYLLLDMKNDIVFFASEKPFLEHICSIKFRGFKFVNNDDFHFIEVSNDKVIILGKDGLEKEAHFPYTTYYNSNSNYYSSNKTYSYGGTSYSKKTYSTSHSSSNKIWRHSQCDHCKSHAQCVDIEDIHICQTCYVKESDFECTQCHETLTYAMLSEAICGHCLVKLEIPDSLKGEELNV